MSTVITAELKLDGSKFKKGAEEAKRGADQVKQSGEGLANGSQTTAGELGKLQRSLGLVSAASGAASGSVTGTASAAIQASRSFAAFGVSMKTALAAGAVLTAVVAIGAALWRCKEAAEAAAAAAREMRFEEARDNAERTAAVYDRMSRAIRSAADAARALTEEQGKGRGIADERARIELETERQRALAASPENAAAINREFDLRAARMTAVSDRRQGSESVSALDAEIAERKDELTRLRQRVTAVRESAAAARRDARETSGGIRDGSWIERRWYSGDNARREEQSQRSEELGMRLTDEANRLHDQGAELERHIALLEARRDNAAASSGLADLKLGLEEARIAAAAAAEEAARRTDDGPKPVSAHAETSRAANSLAAVGGYLSGNAGAMTLEQQQLAESRKQTKTMEDMVAEIKAMNNRPANAQWG